MTLPDALRAARFEVRMQCASSPRLEALYPTVTWRGRYKILRADGKGHRHETRESLVLPDTELVVDGFQGSANTYFVRAFRYAQEQAGRPPVQIAHHLHAATAVRKAARLGLPTLVAMREPVKAALSLVSRWPYVSLAQALRHHALYYGSLQPHAQALVISPFAATTRRPDLVIEAINERFGTDFAPFPLTEAHLKAVRPQIMTPEKKASKARRAAIKKEKQAEWERSEAQRWLHTAEEAYRRLLDHAPPALKTPEDLVKP